MQASDIQTTGHLTQTQKCLRGDNAPDGCEQLAALRLRQRLLEHMQGQLRDLRTAPVPTLQQQWGGGIARTWHHASKARGRRDARVKEEVMSSGKGSMLTTAQRGAQQWAMMLC